MKVSVKYTGPGGNAQTWFEGVQKDMIGGIKEVIREGAEDGEELTQTFIATRGTMKSGKQGRVLTGKMLDAVESDYTDSGKSSAEGRFGWLKEFEKYFGYQEDGFDHVGGVTVDGMYAISDADAAIRDEVYKKIGDIVRGS